MNRITQLALAMGWNDNELAQFVHQVSLVAMDDEVYSSIIEKEKLNVNLKMSELMDELGLGKSSKGRVYLEESIMLLLKDVANVEDMKDNLFVKVANLHNVSPYVVDKEIRSVISALWGTSKLFKAICGKSSKEPTPRKVIIKLTSELQRRLRK